MIGKYNKSLMNFLATSSIDDIKFGKDDTGIGYLKHVFEIHKKELGQTCTNCPGKLDGYIRNVQAFLKQHLKMKNSEKEKESNYKLKQSVLIRHKGKNVTAHNLTDELAKEILSENENRNVLFVKLPKNWKTESQESEEVETDNTEDENQINETDSEIETESQESEEVLSFEERKAELEEMHYSKISKLVEDLGHDYSLLKKDKSIDVILESEFTQK